MSLSTYCPQNNIIMFIWPALEAMKTSIFSTCFYGLMVKAGALWCVMLATHLNGICCVKYGLGTWKRLLDLDALCQNGQA